MTSPEQKAHIREPLALREIEVKMGSTINAAYGRMAHDKGTITVEPTVGPNDPPQEIPMSHLEALAHARHRLAQTGLGSCSTETDQERAVRKRLYDPKDAEPAS